MDHDVFYNSVVDRLLLTVDKLKYINAYGLAQPIS
jgi:hypothetical protein